MMCGSLLGSSGLRMGLVDGMTHGVWNRGLEGKTEGAGLTAEVLVNDQMSFSLTYVSMEQVLSKNYLVPSFTLLIRLAFVVVGGGTYGADPPKFLLAISIIAGVD